jgi:hypothetical protein
MVDWVGDQPHRCDSSSDTDQASAAKVALEIWTFLHSSQPWVQANEQVKLLYWTWAKKYKTVGYDAKMDSQLLVLLVAKNM